MVPGCRDAASLDGTFGPSPVTAALVEPGFGPYRERDVPCCAR